MHELTMISDHHNYDNGYIGLVNIELSNLPKKLLVGEYELLLKSEFHISLISAKKIAALIDQNRATEIQAEIVEVFKQFTKVTPLADYELTNQFRLVKRDERVTLVVLAVVPGIENFFAELEEKYDKKLPVQVTHITLYTLQPEAGIGILSLEELERDSKAVDISLRLR
jgi:hypothetical protein